MPQDTASLPVRPLTSVMTTSTRVKPVKTSPNGVGSPRVTNHTKNGNDRRKAPIKKPLPNGNNNTSNSLRVGVWRLQSNEFTEFAPPEKTESLFNGQSSESVIGGDGRKVVPKKHLMPGGKYRAIVKLFLRFAGQPEGSAWAMATGWLIENDLLVTAGHCAYDWSHRYGLLTHVKAYIGYSGKEAASDTQMVQLRMGIRVATTEGWLINGSSDSRGDVSLIRVNKPFTGVTPFKYLPTPMSGTEVRIGVVGYPGDLKKKRTGEKGAMMYEMFQSTNYSLAKGKAHMLQYTIDTFGGNSGSPVVRQSDMSSIGVHVLGGNPNSASVISGNYGNSFEGMKTAIKYRSKTKVGATNIPANGILWVSVPNKPILGTQAAEKDQLDVPTVDAAESLLESSETTKPGQILRTARPVAKQVQSDAFARALQNAMKVTTDPLGAIAAYGLHVAGMQARQLRLNQDADSSEDAEAGSNGAADEAIDDDAEADQDETDETDDAEKLGEMDETDETDEADEAVEYGDDEANLYEVSESAFEGVSERAILIEAAFATLIELGPEKCQKLGYLDKVRPYVQKYNHTCGRAGGIIFPHLMAPFLRVTIEKVNRQKQARDSETDVDSLRPITAEDANTAEFGPVLDANTEAIIQEITRSIDSTTIEAFDGTDTTFAEVISKGLRIPGAILANVAESDLGDLVQHAEVGLDNEASLEAAMNDHNSPEYLYSAMAQRALIGEAMLESILGTPVESQREEGIFNWLSKAVGKITPVLKDVAPWVGVGMAAYTIGKDVYKAVKNKKQNKKREFEDGGNESELNEGSESAESNDWESFFNQQVAAPANTEN